MSPVYWTLFAIGGPTGPTGPYPTLGVSVEEGPIDVSIDEGIANDYEILFTIPAGATGPTGGVGDRGINWWGPYLDNPNRSFNQYEAVSYKGSAYIQASPSQAYHQEPTPTSAFLGFAGDGYPVPSDWLIGTTTCQRRGTQWNFLRVFGGFQCRPRPTDDHGYWQIFSARVTRVAGNAFNIVGEGTTLISSHGLSFVRLGSILRR
jgi:hypothetical protein